MQAKATERSRFLKWEEIPGKDILSFFVVVDVVFPFPLLLGSAKKTTCVVHFRAVVACVLLPSSVVAAAVTRGRRRYAFHRIS